MLDCVPAMPVRAARALVVLIGRAFDSLDAWVSNEPASGTAAEIHDRLLPWERVGDMNDHRACMTALALSPRCLASQPVPEQCHRFVADYAAAHPEYRFAERFALRTDDEVLDPEQARAEMTKTLQFMWPEFEGWTAGPPLEHLIEDYRFDTQGSRFWYLPLLREHTREATDADLGFSRWPFRVVEGERVPVKPSHWLANRDNGLVVDSVGWLPGQRRLVRNLIVTKTGRSYVPGVVTLNTWQPGPELQHDAPEATPFLFLVGKLFAIPVEREEVLNRMAYMVQNPGKFPNGFCALVGPQGVGKDALMLAFAYCLGWHNVRNIAPAELVGRFNEWLCSQLVVVAEFRLDPREGGANALYEQLKHYFMIPAEVVQIDDKNEKRWSHHKTAGCFILGNTLPAFDIPENERHGFFPEIGLKPEWHAAEGRPAFFTDYFRWLRHERGYAAVHKYLAARDLRSYDPTAKPPMSRTKRQAQEASKGGDDAIGRAIAKLGRPEVFFEIELHDLARRDPNGTGLRDFELLAALRLKSRAALIEGAGYVRFPSLDGRRWRMTVLGENGGQKASTAAYVLRQVWDEIEGATVERHLRHRLRRLALVDPRLTGAAPNDSEWLDPTTGAPLMLLPRIMTPSPDEGVVEGELEAGDRLRAAADAFEARARRDLAEAARLRRDLGELDLSRERDDSDA